MPEDELLEVYAEGEAQTTEDIMNATKIEDAPQQELRQQPVDEDAAPQELSMGGLSSILSAVNHLKTSIIENEVRVLSRLNFFD